MGRLMLKKNPRRSRNAETPEKRVPSGFTMDGSFRPAEETAGSSAPDGEAVLTKCRNIV